METIQSLHIDPELWLTQGIGGEDLRIRSDLQKPQPRLETSDPLDGPLGEVLEGYIKFRLLNPRSDQLFLHMLTKSIDFLEQQIPRAGLDLRSLPHV